MEQSQDITELASAMASFQAEMSPVGKSANNPFFKSKYADLASVMKEAMPLTSKNGLAIVQFPGVAPDSTEVLYTQITHKSGQWMRSCMKLHLTKNDAQGQGSALTYAKRYAAMAALGIVADEDDDGNAASKAKTLPKKQPVSQGAPLANQAEQDQIRAAAMEAWGVTTDEDISETLGWELTKIPKAKVTAAIDKIWSTVKK